MALAGPRSSKKLKHIVYSQEKRKARKAIIEAIDAEGRRTRARARPRALRKNPSTMRVAWTVVKRAASTILSCATVRVRWTLTTSPTMRLENARSSAGAREKIAQKLKEWEDNNARNYVLWHRVQKEVHGELRIRASRESASVAGDNHVDVQFDRYLRVSKLLEMKDWIHKDLPSLPMEARVLHHKAQKRVLELEETVTRLLQDVGYAADISMGASPTPAPFRRDLPQSGTHQARTSTPRRTGKSDTIHMKRKALMTIPQKIADVDSNSEESDEEEMVTEEKKAREHTRRW
ncbi:hypothetical protein J8273_7618 [Carpediemonas membranifera]|uniref:Uncharacterized protein n=1 Tax=Carpediemonas membranifera TaxID=201153 RepID=A0A8J6B735_9EUKA|nr:hypothetical protein J8273_7618 [Carpediemonas membranifera]|eukprot:KAG9391332.1 hypothetical protein J8273_7618 [Carpediemonas membranifera]